MRNYRQRATALIASCVFILTGCGGGSRTLPAHDDALSEMLMETRAEGDPLQLADLTPFDWDIVYVFEPYVNGDFINTTVGQSVVPSSYQHASDAENVLVFLANGALEHAATVRRVGIGPDSSQRYVTGTSEAWLIPTDVNGQVSLKLSEELLQPA
jgi:hypothetical protein